jgi:hypothetical protein
MQQEHNSGAEKKSSSLQDELDALKDKNTGIEQCFRRYPYQLSMNKAPVIPVSDPQELDGFTTCPICKQVGISSVYQDRRSCLRCPADHLWWRGTGEMLTEYESHVDEERSIPVRVAIAYEQQRLAWLKKTIQHALALVWDMPHLKDEELDSLCPAPVESNGKKRKADAAVDP